MIDPKRNNNNDDLIEALKTEEDDEIIVTKKSNFEFKDKMKKILLLIVLITVLLVIIFWLLSLRAGGKKSFSDVEKVMASAAKEYYSEHKSLLPSTNKATSEVSLQKLVNGNYMKEVSKYNSKASNCSGKVIVENNDDSYLYVAYLDCGNNYTTTELYREITKSSNVVTSDSGVYYMNNEYVYRGEKVNNFVKMDDNLWRIVKVDSNNDVVLISNDAYRNTRKWDDRYNSERKLNYGYNDYKISRIKEFLDEVYTLSKKGDTSKYNVLPFSKSTAKHLVGYKLCYGNSNFNQSLNNNTYECQKVIENTKIGLLTLSDYINASLDSTCVSPSSKSCQNYNYLSQLKRSWWLVTGNAANSYEVYEIDDSGRVNIINASGYASVRPVVHLSSKAMYKSGTGSEDNPYIIK
ncbi:MAG: hypothetical protein IKO49_08285 [Bacilli bacterium]|nr:hypothetical protein [Bacilli bacterium]